MAFGGGGHGRRTTSGRSAGCSGRSLETWENRYAFEVGRERQLARFTRGGLQAAAGVVAGGVIRVAYESAPHEVAEEFCTTPEQAAALIDAITARERLCRVPKPEAD